MADPVVSPNPAAPIQDKAQLEQFLHAPMENLPQGTGGAMRDLLPLAAKELRGGETGGLVEQEMRPGVPIQVNPPEDAFGGGVMGNVNPWTRFQTARRQTTADQQKYLETQFGVGKVRKAKNSDDFLIEVPDPETGKPKEILLNEQDITLGDLAAVAGKAPEIGLAILSSVGAGKLLKAPAIVRGLAQLIGGAAGLKAGEAGEQIATEAEQGQKPDVGGILATKAKELPGQAALDLGTAGIFKTASLLKRVGQGGPGMFKTAAQTEGLPAEAALRAKTGQGISYSGAEASGMPLLAFLEAYAQAKPQATAVMQKFKDAQLGEVKALAEAISSKAGTDEEAGNKLLDFLNANQKVKQDALDAVRATMTKKESDALTKQLGKVAPVAKPFTPSVAGGEFRDEVQAAHQAVKTKVSQAYTDAYGVPGAALPEVPTKPIAQEIDHLLSTSPTVEGIQWLKNYKNTLADKESYKDIVNRRSDLWNKIEESPADRTTKDYLHGQLSKAMTDTLDDASKNILNPQFRGLIQKANDLYKSDELPFYQQGMYDILRKAGVRGAPENMELLDRFKANTDLYRRLVDVTGAKGKPVQIIKSAVMDGLLTKSGTSAIDPQFIDSKQFIKNLSDLSSDPKTREMFNDIFGTRGKAILEQAKVLGGIQGSIPKEQAEGLLSGKAPTISRGRLKAVLDAQNQVDTVEAKRLLKAPVDQIQPEKFVNSYTDKLSESELGDLAARIAKEAPPLYEQLQDKQVEQILGKSGTYQTWTRSSIEKVLHDPKWEPKYRAILGPKFDDVEMFAKALGPIEQAEKTAEGTGMLVKGESIGGLASIFKIKPGGKKSGSTIGRIGERALEEIPGWLGWKWAAYGITSGAFRQWASKDFPQETANLIPKAIASEPFLADLASSASSPALIRNLVMRVRDYTKRVGQPAAPEQEQQPVKSRKELEQFLKE